MFVANKFAPYFTVHLAEKPTHITLVLHKQPHPIEVGTVGPGCPKSDCIMAYTTVERASLLALLQADTPVAATPVADAPVEVPLVAKADGTAQPIWERRLLLNKAQRAERDERLEGLDEKYHAAFDALKVECGQTPQGHEWTFNHWNVGGAEIYYCNHCNARKIVEEGEPA